MLTLCISFHLRGRFIIQILSSCSRLTLLLDSQIQMTGKREAEADPPASAEKKAKIDTSGYTLNVNLAVDKKHESKPLR
jgi:hypothetical protein